MAGWQWRNVPVPESHVTSLAAGLAFERLRPAPLTGHRSLARTAGGLLAISGALLAAWAVRASGEIDLESPASLVTSGPYRITRNPMYVAWTVASVGIALLANSAWALVAMPVAVLASHTEVLREEQDLAARFGEGYERYRSLVPRYL